MSCVHLLCSDHPLPLCAPQCDKDGFAVRPLAYYRTAVDDLGLSMNPCRYELELHATAQDAAALRDYLTQHCTPGEAVELWHLWVGDVNVRAFRLAGRLADLDTDTLEQLNEREQTCIILTL